MGWSWGDTEQKAFDALKTAVTSAPTLVFPSESGTFRLECDTSNFATGAVLSQHQSDSSFQPIAFMSKGFSDVEQNCVIHNKEMVAIIRALEDWCHFLEGSSESFKVFTDHKNLAYFHDAQKLNHRQAHWSLILSKFNFSLLHKPGHLMGKPDALSRHPDHPSGHKDNWDIMLLPKSVFEICVTECVILNGHNGLLNHIWECKEFDECISKALENLGKGILHSSKWDCQDGVILHRGHIYVLKDPKLCHNIVDAHHSSQSTGHPRKWKMLELVCRNYWWPGISHYITKFTSGCESCNCCKSFPSKQVGKLMPNPVPSKCWQIVSVDMIGELPDSRGFNAILVVVDRLSKCIHVVPTVTSLDSTGVACLFLENVWQHHGLPKQILSDHSPAFISHFSRELANLLGLYLTNSFRQMARQRGWIKKSRCSYDYLSTIVKMIGLPGCL